MTYGEDVERVARALLAQEWGPQPHPWDTAAEWERDFCCARARAAIAALDLPARDRRVKAQALDEAADRCDTAALIRGVDSVDLRRWADEVEAGS